MFGFDEIVSFGNGTSVCSDEPVLAWMTITVKSYKDMLTIPHDIDSMMFEERGISLSQVAKE